MRRTIALLVTLVLLVAACGDTEDQGAEATGDPEVDGASEDTTTPPPGDTAATPPTAGETRGTSPGGAPPNGAEPASPPATSSSPDEPARNEHLGPPGSFAGVLLRPEPAPALFLEVLVQAGAQPSQGAIDRLAAQLSRVSGKPVTTTKGTVEGDRTSWSAADVRAAADANAGMAQGSGGAVVRLLYLRGSSSDAGGALGVAARGDVAAIFADQVRESTTPLIGSDAIERAVSLHEIGHLLGLVDLFLQTGRADPEHPGHSPNDRSVMYWAVETGLFADLSGDLPQDFDAADLADLEAIRAG